MVAGVSNARDARDAGVAPARGDRLASQPMLLPPIAYLAWARRFYGQVDCDLATSGVRTIACDTIAALAGSAPPRPDDAGAPARFRSAIAARYGVPEGEVVPCLGTSGALFTTYAAALAPGDEVLVESPTYEPMAAVARGLGLAVRSFARRPDFGVDPEAVLAALGPATRVVTLADPHNPSGVCLGDEVLAALARALDARGVALLVDEVYRERVTPGRTARRHGPNVWAVSSLTKCFGLGWARAGWAILPEAIAAHAGDVNAHVAGELPPAHAAHGAWALGAVEALAREVERRQVGSLEHVEAFLRRHAGAVAWSQPAPGVSFGVISARDPARAWSRATLEAGIASERVIVAPGEFFGAPGAVRVSFTAPADVVRDGLERLERVLGLG